jgi:hypothetical protein
MFQQQSIEVALSLVCTDELKRKVLAIESEIKRISPNFVCDARAIIAGAMPTQAKSTDNPLGKDEVLTRTNLFVDFSEKDSAKSLGARWDGINKTWYCIGDTSKFKQWLKPAKRKFKTKKRR